MEEHREPRSRRSAQRGEGAGESRKLHLSAHSYTLNPERLETAALSFGGHFVPRMVFLMPYMQPEVRTTAQ